MEPAGEHGQWMAENTTCPHCNIDDATTLIVRGLDGLLII